MALSTPYDLPFRATAPATGELAAGAEFTLEVTMPMTAPGFEAMGSVVTAWFVLARTGAMCGERLAASKSTIDSLSGPVAQPTGIAWTMRGVWLDDAAAIVLHHMLLTEWEARRFTRAAFSKVGSPTTVQPVVHDPKQWAPYPRRDRTTTFRIALSTQPMGRVAIRILFATAPDDAQIAAIAERLGTWAGVTVCGAYGNAPTPPLASGLSFDPAEIEVVDDRLTWSLSKFQADVGSLDGLANVVAAIDQSIVGVRELVVT